jgi:hypothetical protein
MDAKKVGWETLVKLQFVVMTVLMENVSVPKIVSVKTVGPEIHVRRLSTLTLVVNHVSMGNVLRMEVAFAKKAGLEIPVTFLYLKNLR